MTTSDNYSNIIELIKKRDFKTAEIKIKAVHNKDIKEYLTGLLKYQKNEFDEAKKLLKNSTENFPDNVEIKRTYGLLLHRLARYKEALVIYKDTLKLSPNNSGILNSVGVIENLYGNNIEAGENFKKAIENNPEYIEPYLNLGNTKKDSGNIDEAIAFYEKALEYDSKNLYAISNIMLAKCYTATNSEELMATYKKYDTILNPEKNSIAVAHPLSGRKIKIAYLSGDFKQHSVTYFFEPIIANHNLNEFEIYCYSDVPNPDPVTMRLSGYPVNWRNIYGMSDEEVKKKIASDNPDIIIDLAGHANNKRIKIFSERVAPVQITYCGYPFSTGLVNMDYRITDTTADPIEEDKYYTEKLIRLEPPFLCYRPPKKTPPISELPILKKGFITFGSFNNIAKIQEETLKLWSRLLNEIPTAKLFLKNRYFNNRKQRQLFIDKCEKYSIKPECLLFSEYSPSLTSHLEQYSNVDIALDTFPYNGTTTTCEALWMGIPVISLSGTSHHTRVGKTILESVGLSGLACSDDDNLVQAAIYLSQNIESLSKLRKNLRLTVANSDLCNASKFTKKLEDSYKSTLIGGAE